MNFLFEYLSNISLEFLNMSAAIYFLLSMLICFTTAGIFGWLWTDNKSIKMIVKFSIFLFMVLIPNLVVSIFDNHVSSKFNEALKNKELVVLEGLRVFKKEKIDNGFVFIPKNEINKEVNLVGRLSCGKLSLNQCLDEFSKNQDKIISQIKEDFGEQKYAFFSIDSDFTK